jgi:nicotinamide-nucleotide amidase
MNHEFADTFLKHLDSEALDCSDESLYLLASRLISRLRQKQLTLAAAESCSGGWIGKLITDIPGSSDVFVASIVTYANQAKTRLLGVSPSVLQTQGAVSQAVVEAMAAAVQQQLAVDCSLSVSGVAGPGGGSDDKPVGTVWICWRVNAQSLARCFLFAGDRQRIRRCTCYMALAGLETLLQS